MRAICIIIVLLCLSVGSLAQCSSISCGAGDECIDETGAFCGSNFFCGANEGCLTHAGHCQNSGKLCAVRYCIEFKNCPPNPNAIFGVGRAPDCKARISDKEYLRARRAQIPRLFGVARESVLQ